MRKYEVDDCFFDEIDNEAKAYFFGLLLADGTNNVKDGLIVIDLQDSDLPILQQLNDLVQPTRPIKRYENKYSKTDRFRLTICSRQISQSLLKKGMVSNKSYLLKEVSGVPEELMHHFIRGYFDGNGSIGVFGEVGNVELSIVSTRTFLSQVQQQLMKNCNISQTKFGKRHRDRVDEVYHMKYTGRFSCLKIREYMYKDATYSIERKRVKFFSIPLVKPGSNRDLKDRVQEVKDLIAA